MFNPCVFNYVASSILLLDFSMLQERVSHMLYHYIVHRASMIEETLCKLKCIIHIAVPVHFEYLGTNVYNKIFFVFAVVFPLLRKLPEFDEIFTVHRQFLGQEFQENLRKFGRFFSNKTVAS